MALAKQRRRFGHDHVRPALEGWVVGLVALGLVARGAVHLAGLPTALGEPWPGAAMVGGMAVMTSFALGLLVVPFGGLMLASAWLLASGRRLLPRLAYALLCLAVSVLTYGATRAPVQGWQAARMAAFHQLGLRAQPLVDALRAYQRDHGTPAPSLAALVPRYLAAVPGTGLVGYPVFGYEPASSTTQRHRLDDGWDLLVYCDDQRYAWADIVPADDGAPPRKSYLTRADAERWIEQLRHPHPGRLVDELPPTDDEQPPAEGGWRLVVSCSFGFGFDQFYYLPTERYPRFAHGGEIERLGRWAYVHE